MIAEDVALIVDYRSKIDKLSILGVRSFDNIRSETIQFHTPLTLIVGYNGSGKTTIIECLKYATTGQLPPNSKGGAFIHDPKLCGEKEVLAQVKLSFKGTQGARLVVTRSLQLTVKKTTRSQKTLEGQLLMIKDGERTTISSRVAELDQIMPQYLGVSEAILDSVIFCHQDESLWPMSEPSVLKRKFDEIFEALKYTKAIENIKTVRKNQGIALAKHKMFEDQYKTEKDRGERAEKKSIQLQDEIEKLRTESEHLTRDMQVALDSARENTKQAQEFQGIVNELKNKRYQAERRREDVDDLKDNLTELQESDQKLEDMLARSEDTMETNRAEEQSYQESYAELRKELGLCRQKQAGRLAEQGQYKAEKENYDRQITDREKLVKEAARKHQVRGYEGDIDDGLINSFIDRMGKLAKDKSRELERIQQSLEDDLREAQSILTSLQSRRSACTQDKVNARQLVTDNNKRIVSMQDSIGNIQIDEGEKAKLESTLSELREKLNKSTNDAEQSGWDKLLQSENSKLRDLEVERSRLNDQLVQSSRMAEDRAQLDYYRKELKDRQRSLDTMKATYGDKLSSIVGDDWKATTLAADFQDALDQKTSATQEAQIQRDVTVQEMQQVEFKLLTARDSRKRKLEEMKSCEKAVLNSILSPEGQALPTIEDYLPELSKLESDRDLIKSDIDNFTHLNKFWSGCIETAERENQCHLCDRKFQPGEKSATISKLRSKLAKDARETLTVELKEMEDMCGDAQAVRSQYETHVRLSTAELPALEKDIKKLDDQRSTLIKRLEGQDNSVREEESAKLDIESLAKSVSTIVRYVTDITGFEEQIASIASQQKLSGSHLSVNDIQSQQEICNKKSDELKSQIAKLVKEKDESRSRINLLELDLRDAGSKMVEANHQMQRKEELLQRIQEMKEVNAGQQEAINRADSSLKSLEPEIKNAEAKLTNIRNEGKTKEKAVGDESFKISETVNKLRLADKAIRDYIDDDGPGKLKACEQSIIDLEREISRIDAEISDVTEKANAIKEQIDNSERIKRNISDNIKYRKFKRALDVLNAEIVELELRNANEDLLRLSREAEKQNMRHQKLLANRGPILGAMRAKDDELRGILLDWETEYKDAAKNYRESHIKVEITKAAIEDLARYGTALDQAIMKYHSLKMEEINRIAGELWQSTYQGTDVDTILIRSDAENAAGRSNYNYRVCMVKQDAEMDMRGRCSAGQRVLASIIIRLALAECFGVNCGLIALDEPTTNLDRDNIRSLAESLHGIIRTRQAQSNFQLIVITHDEEFLRYMKCADFCDHYYRISRDDKQKSIIERQTITEVI
ncbi:hypothetical protein GMDG_02537 [Pseudogymnoascus destructans 20631-21]|uniref:DNA repair protein RAD50 n=2 Tax=Pseudogymnoascus destructans TaxID=655981 RepID=L8G2P5_PSED2|nr:hypothetical protein GMDG_02537 [Pseudogymnoascus destructans 20631-21]